MIKIFINPVGATRMSFATTEAIPSDVDKKDEGLVFVAGATGKVGSRTVRLLSRTYTSNANCFIPYFRLIKRMDSSLGSF